MVQDVTEYICKNCQKKKKKLKIKIRTFYHWSHLNMCKYINGSVVNMSIVCNQKWNIVSEKE